MARTWSQLTTEEILALWQLEWLSNNTIVYKDNSWIIKWVALWDNWTVLQSNWATSDPSFEEASWGWWYAESAYIAWEITDETLLWEWPIWAATTLSAWYIGLTTAPTWSSFIITVAKSTDNGSTYPTTETVTLTATNNYVKWTLTTAFAEWDWIKATVTQIWSTVAWSNLYFKAVGS